MRAKPTRSTSPFWPALPTITWTVHQRQLLLEDLDLDVKKDPAHCAQAITNISREVAEHHGRLAARRHFPSLAAQLATLKAFQRAIQPLPALVLGLSPLVVTKIKTGRIDHKVMQGVEWGKDDLDESQKLEEVMGRVAVDLAALNELTHCAIEYWSKPDLRGRPESPAIRFVQQLQRTFEHFRKGPPEEDLSACLTFIRHVCDFQKIKKPSHLSALLRKQ